MAIEPAVNPLTGQPLDLSFAGLRSISPFHLDHTRSMGVRATLTISLTHGDRLWGMLLCHHETPRRVGAEMRSCCTLVSQLFSLLMASKEDHERRLHNARLAAREVRIIDAMTRSDDLAGAFTAHRPRP